MLIGTPYGFAMSEVLFYHMTESRLEQALPGLLERSLERGWKVVVQTSTPERRDALDAHLWTHRDDSFLPHGSLETATDPSKQPIWITEKDDNPNAAEVRFLVDGAIPGDLSEYLRAVYMFDGHNAEAVAAARQRWKFEKEAGHDLTYWQQGEGGRWEQKA